METPATRLRAARIQAGYSSGAAFATAHNIKGSTYGSHENGTRKLSIDAAKEYAGPLGTTWQELMFGDEFDIAPRQGNEPPPRRDRLAPALILDEVDVTARGGAGNPLSDIRFQETVVAKWQIPSAVIRHYTSAPQDRIKIITVIGDSMAPDFLPGERVMVSLEDTTPSPPGVFAIWDGFGEVIKRAEMIPYSEPPRVRLISANKEYEPREIELDQLVVNGRVLGKWQWT